MRIYIGTTLVILTLVMAVLISLIFGPDSVNTQIFYIPIILAGLFNYRRAMYVGLLFGFIHIFLALFLIFVAHKDVSLTDQIVRGAMYVLVAFVVGTLSERQDALLSKVKESEEKYRFIATSIDDGIIALDLGGKVTYANPRTYEITGFSPGESMGKPMSELLSDQTRQEIKKLYQEVLGGGKAIEREIEIGIKSGKRITVEINISVLRNSEGKITGVVAAFRDVTERKLTQAALKRSRDFYFTLLESFPGLIWHTGPDGKGNYFNRNWLEFTGRDTEHESGDGWLAGVHEQDRDQHTKVFREAFEARKAFEAEFRMQRKDGAWRWLLESGRPFQDLDGNFAGYIGFVYDITERKEATEELRHRNRELWLLNSISSGINRSQDMQGMLYSVLTDVMSLLQVNSGAIYLADNARPGQMSLRASLPYAASGSPELFRQAFIPDIRVDSGKVYVAAEALAGCLAAAGDSGTVITVPVATRSRLVGLMAFYAGPALVDRGRWAAESTTAQLLSVGSQLGIAIENQVLFNQIKDTSQHLSDIIDESPDAMLTTDMAGVIRSFNKSASRLLKYAPGEVVGRHLSTLLPPGASFKPEAARSYVREFRCKDDSLINLNISSARLSRSDVSDGFIITLKDLSGIAGLKIMPLAEQAVDSVQEYHFDKGVIYLMDKSKVDHYMDIFTDQVMHNIQGLCISRQNPQAIRDHFGLEKTPLVWLNGGDAVLGETAIKPGNLSSLTATVSDFVAKAGDGVVMLDGMEYLMARNGFDSMLKFVQYLNDRIMDSDSRAFFCIDTGALDDKQRHLLLTEMVEFKEQA
jgi:PAS domain S-box-containing protein